MSKWLRAVAVLLVLAGVAAFLSWRSRAPAVSSAGAGTASDGVPLAVAGSPLAAAGSDGGEVPELPGPLPTLGGEVRDAIGGVAQAEVRVALRGESTEKEQCQVRASTRSVAGGGFAFGPLCPGQYDVVAERDAQVANAVVHLQRGTDRTPLVLELSDSMQLTVRVEGDAHQPVIGAKVSVQDEASGFERTSLTDATGAARFERSSARPHTISATAQGFLRKSLYRHVMATGVNEVKLTLVSGLMLEGRVVGPDGLPVVVTLTLALPRVSKFSSPDVMDSAETSGGGVFSLGPVVRGNYLVVVDGEPWERIEQPVKLPSQPLTLKLSRGATVEGEFLDEKGAPIRHAEVWFLLEGGGSRSVKLEPDAEGVFRVEGVRSGQHSVVGASEEEDGGPGAVTSAIFSVRGAQTTHLTLRLERGRVISGDCVVERPGDGRPPMIFAADESLVRRMKWNDHPDALAPGAFSIARCAPGFELKGLRAGRYALICDGSDDEPVAWARAGDTHLSVRCPTRVDSRHLRFRVTDEQGRAVTQFGLSEGRFEQHPEGKYDSETWDEGSFVLKVFAPGYAALTREVRSEKNHDVDLGTLVFTRARTLTGRVVEQGTHQPIEGAVVSFGVSSESAEQLMRTGPDGTFTLRGVPAEDSVIHVEHPAWLPVKVAVLARQDQLEFELSAAARVLGTVVTHDGRIIDRVTVKATAGSALHTATVEHGGFELGPLPNGAYVVRLDLGGFAPVPLEVAAPGTYRVNFVERLGGASFAVELLDENHLPVDAAGWLVPGAQPRPATQAAQSQLIQVDAVRGDRNSEGQLLFSSVPPGTWTLLVKPERDPTYLYSQTLTVSESMASVVHATLPMTPLPP